jgi:hypothetical protein
MELAFLWGQLFYGVCPAPNFNEGLEKTAEVIRNFSGCKEEIRCE